MLFITNMQSGFSIAGTLHMQNINYVYSPECAAVLKRQALDHVHKKRKQYELDSGGSTVRWFGCCLTETVQVARCSVVQS